MSDFFLKILHHATHATHAAHATGATSDRGVLLGEISDHALSGGHKGGNRRGIDEGSSDDLDGVDDASLDHVAIRVGLGVVAIVAISLAEQVANDNRALNAGIVGNASARGLDGYFLFVFCFVCFVKETI